VLAATHPGDSEFKPAVQQAHMFVPVRNKPGADQTISFPEIPDQKAGTKTVRVNATTSAKLPVEYFVREGPAEVPSNILFFTEVPPRAKLRAGRRR
jgi:hypothetical protein